MELTIGMKFTSKWFEGITEILAINKDENSIVVEISREGGHSHQENWNMEHTIWGFQRGEYLQVNPEVNYCDCNVAITNCLLNGFCIKCKKKVSNPLSHLNRK